MQKFSRVRVPNVMQDVLMKLAQATTEKKCLLPIRLDKLGFPESASYIETITSF